MSEFNKGISLNSDSVILFPYAQVICLVLYNIAITQNNKSQSKPELSSKHN